MWKYSAVWRRIAPLFFALIGAWLLTQWRSPEAGSEGQQASDPAPNGVSPEPAAGHNARPQKNARSTGVNEADVAAEPAPSRRDVAEPRDPEPSHEDLAPGGVEGLRAVGGDVWRSAAGLLYGPGSAQGHRVLHVLKHLTDQPSRAGPHGVFSVGRERLIAVIDEAYELSKKGGPQVEMVREKERTVFTVNLKREIGFVGGQTGSERGRPKTTHLRLVLEGKHVITAFPVLP
jgi:hypothetical protein